jgi:hypothetical protein
MPSDEFLTTKSTMINHEYKTIHTALQNISHLIFNDFLTNAHTNAGTLGYSIPFTELCWTDSWHWDFAATDIAKHFSQWNKNFDNDNNV